MLAVQAMGLMAYRLHVCHCDRIEMQKFGFKIRTKAGALVDNLVIQAQDAAKAELRLMQMYRHATILEARIIEEPQATIGADLESAISLIIGRHHPLGR